MASRLLFALLLPAILLSGCALRGRGSKVAYTVDVAGIVIGTTAIVAADNRECETGPYFEGLGCEVGSGLLGLAGAAALTAGALGLIVNYAVNVGVEDDEQPPPTTIAHGAAAPGEPPTLCARLLDAWRAERDLERKTELFEAMPGVCQAALTPSAPR